MNFMKLKMEHRSEKARFNEFITGKLLAGAKDGLVRPDVKEQDIEVAWVPGAFEIPLIASKMVKNMML